MSCADTCVVMDYDGSTDFYRERERRAAKPYRCCECHHEIATGELHEYVTGKCEGMFFTERTCVACAEVRKAFCCGPWVLGELWEAIDDQLFSGWNEMTAIDCLARLSSQAAIDKMRAMYAWWRGDESTPTEAPAHE